MNPILKNILAVIAGWIGGSMVNGGLVEVGYLVYPLEGVDVTDFAALGEALSTASAEHFIFPYIAHALGALVGGLIAYFIANEKHKMTMALVVGGVFLLGGIAVNVLIPAPTWFKALDILTAYIPMAWLGGKIASGLSRKNKV